MNRVNEIEMEKKLLKNRLDGWINARNVTRCCRAADEDDVFISFGKSYFIPANFTINLLI